ncbi:MAG: hypothetical protein K9M75_06100 [Phycisphaerae bacterium]|nr:hypothetical protein [Phycisphaerae bacterium]
MKELVYYVLCFIGVAYLLYRIAFFFKTTIKLLLSYKGAVKGTVRDKVTQLCHCNLSFLADLEKDEDNKT